MKSGKKNRKNFAPVYFHFQRKKYRLELSVTKLSIFIFNLGKYLLSNNHRYQANTLFNLHKTNIYLIKTLNLLIGATFPFYSSYKKPIQTKHE